MHPLPIESAAGAGLAAMSGIPTPPCPNTAPGCFPFGLPEGVHLHLETGRNPGRWHVVVVDLHPRV